MDVYVFVYVCFVYAAAAAVADVFVVVHEFAPPSSLPLISSIVAFHRSGSEKGLILDWSWGWVVGVGFVFYFI